MRLPFTPAVMDSTFYIRRASRQVEMVFPGWAFLLIVLNLLTVPTVSLADAQTTTHTPKLTPEDHFRAILEEKDAHSLWLLMARGGIRQVRTGESDWMDVNIQTAQSLITQWSQGSDYQHQAKRFLDEMQLPQDWATQNAARIHEFKQTHPGAIVVETEHYHVLSTADPRTTKELALRMDAVFELYDAMFDFEEKIPYKSVIIFWQDKHAYEAHGAPPNSAAYYSPATKTLVGYNTRALSTTRHMDPYQVMFHEGWHQYFDFYIPNAPRWFDEGFAEVFAPTDVKGRKAKLRSNVEQAQIAHRLLLKGQLIPLNKLIRMDHREFTDPRHMTAAYAESYSFITFLMNFRSGNRALQKRVRGFYKNYFWELRKGTDPIAALDIVFGDVKFEVLEDMWKQNIKKRR